MVGAARRWSAIVVVAAVVVVFVLAGGALAAPTTTVAGVVPTPATVAGPGARRGVDVEAGADAPAAGRVGRHAAGRGLPAGARRVVPRRVVALRARTGAAAASAALVPVAVTIATIVLGTRRPIVDPVLTGVRARRRPAAVGGVACGAAACAARRRDGRAPGRGGRRGRRRRPGRGRRDRPARGARRDGAPVRPAGLPEPAVGVPRVREGGRPAVHGQRAARRGAGPARDDGPVRRRRLERRGRRVRAGVRASSGGSAPRSTRPCAATEAHVEFTVDELAGVWLPTVGQATSFDIADADAASALRYNDATGAAVLTGGVHRGPDVRRRRRRAARAGRRRRSAARPRPTSPSRRSPGCRTPPR